MSEVIAWIREQIAHDRARAEKKGAERRDGGRDVRDVLAIADAHEAPLVFLESNVRSTIGLDAASGADVINEMFWALSGNTLLRHVASAYRHRSGYDRPQCSWPAPRAGDDPAQRYRR
ncbi:hypothetical protein [Lentzea sp. CC55]|uniref:hypothetical protein n=1 Tax=Lentzea sp. CC55 TaxID=2884909 RepID=UPI001F3CDCA8|nr:hypothetical protein [Lentzea sp. CC55]MCG8927323.1 hypothetical protein [Lentzea sp. CC55]